MGKKLKKYTVVWCQLWEESERGYGVRPDGYSLHLTREHVKAFEREYWDGMPDEVPHEYSRPAFSDPYAALIDEETYQKLKGAKFGQRSHGRRPPESDPSLIGKAVYLER